MRLIPAFIYRRIELSLNLLKIVDNIGWLFFDKLLRMGVGLLVGVWLARYLGPEQFGLLSFATAFTGMFGAIAALGLQGIVVRDLVLNPDSASETLGTAGFLQLIGGLAAYVLLLVVIDYLRPDDAIARSIVGLLGLTMLLEASKVAVFWFESQVQSKYTVWVQNSVFLVFVALKVALIVQESSLFAFVWATVAEAIIVAIILLGVMNQRGLSLVKLHFSAQRAKILFKDSWPLILSSIAITLHMQIDQIMLGQMVSDGAVGVYSVAVRISEVWYFLIPIVIGSVFPSLANLHAKQSDLLPKRWVQVYALMFWLSVIAALVLTFASNVLIKLLFGDAYAGAAVVLSIHAWAGINVAVGSVWSKWLLLENKLQIGFYGYLFGAVMNVGLNICLIPSYGEVGAALATLVSYWISTIFAMSLYKPKDSFRFILNAILLRQVFKNQH